MQVMLQLRLRLRLSALAGLLVVRAWPVQHGRALWRRSHFQSAELSACEVPLDSRISCDAHVSWHCAKAAPTSPQPHTEGAAAQRMGEGGGPAARSFGQVRHTSLSAALLQARRVRRVRPVQLQPLLGLRPGRAVVEDPCWSRTVRCFYRQRAAVHLRLQLRR